MVLMDDRMRDPHIRQSIFPGGRYPLRSKARVYRHPAHQCRTSSNPNPMAEGARARLAVVSEVEGADARPQPPHGVRGSALPEHRRVLEPRHRDVHDSRRRLHARVRLLRRRARPPAAPSTRQSPRAWPTPSQTLDLAHVVVTSVDRDDLPDGGASIFAETVREIRTRTPTAEHRGAHPRLPGQRSGAARRARRRPDILNHNTETVPAPVPARAIRRAVCAHARAARSLAPLRAGDRHQIGHYGRARRRVGRDRRDARRSAEGRLRDPDARPVPAAVTSTPADDPLLPPRRVPPAEGRSRSTWASRTSSRARWCAAPITRTNRRTRSSRRRAS